MNLCLLQKTRHKSRINKVTPSSLNREQENELTQNETLQAEECYNFCSCTRKFPMGCKGTVMPDRTMKKLFRQVFYIRGEHPEAVQ